ncbi:hypothetical protein RB195_023858 [Necator americanus]|uniref:Uncharacterized protein n=1 Tax=Necator americanus TaxID=51031 RepID=A0ABR1ELC2_NECAM
MSRDSRDTQEIESIDRNSGVTVSVRGKFVELLVLFCMQKELFQCRNGRALTGWYWFQWLVAGRDANMRAESNARVVYGDADILLGTLLTR